MKINTETFSFESIGYLSYFQKKNNYNQLFISNQEVLKLNFPISEILFTNDGKGGCCNKKPVEDDSKYKKSNDKDSCCDDEADSEDKGCCDTNGCQGGCCCS